MHNNRFKKRKINLKFAIYILLITTVLAVVTSTAKFGEVFVGSDNVVVAIPIFSSTTIDLKNIYPEMETKKYDIMIKNTKDNITAQVSMEYTITIENIGNIPLDIKLFKTENNEIIGTNLLNNGTTEKSIMYPEETIHTYNLQIQWNKSIEDYKNYKYSGETSIVRIKTEAVQKD